MDLFLLVAKSALVIGSSRGIGLAIARALTTQGELPTSNRTSSSLTPKVCVKRCCMHRPLVHLIHACHVVILPMAGPARAGRLVLVHDPAARPRRCRWMARLAHMRGTTSPGRASAGSRTAVARSARRLIVGDELIELPIG